MDARVINDFGSLLALKDNWNRLYELDPAAHFFLSWSWVTKWLEDDDGTWFVLALKNRPEDSEYCALMPLRRRKLIDDDGRKVDRIQIATRKLCDYTGWLADPEVEPEASRMLGRCLAVADADEMELECLRAPRERIDRLLEAFDPVKFAVTQRPGIHPVDGIDNTVCPFIDLPDDFDDYLSGLGRSTRQKLRRFLRKVENSDRFTIRLATPDTAHADIDSLLDLWAAKWAKRKGDRIPQLKKTNATMMRHCMGEENLLLPVLLDGDRPISALATFTDKVKGRLLFYMAGRDEEFSEFPSGLVLHAWSIRWAIENGYSIYDFLRGDERYKFMFTTKHEPIRHMIVTARKLDKADRLPPASQAQELLEIALDAHKAGNLALAERAYRKVLKAKPQSAQALYGLGQLLTSTNRPKQAAELFQRIIDRAPTSHKAWLRLGSCHEARGRYDAAADAYREVIRHKPHMPDAHHRLAHALERSGQHLEATLALKTARKLEATGLT